MSELEGLQKHYEWLQAEYQRVGLPILNLAVETHQQIMNLKREAGQLFYVEYMQRFSPYTEECETLADAKGFALALTDNGNGFVTQIHGPGIDLDECEWEDYEPGRDTLSEQS